MIGYYFDEMMSRIIVQPLIEQGITVMMAVDVGMAKKDDSEHIAYATEQGLVLVTMDKPFAGRSQKRTDHSGVVCWTGRQRDFGAMIEAFIQFAETNTPESAKGRVFWLK